MSHSKDVAVETDLAIRRLVARYCHLVDDRDFDAASELFTESARFHVADSALDSQAAIRSWFDSLPEGLMHRTDNVVVSNGSHPGTYHAVSDVTALMKTDAGWTIILVGRYHDTFEGEGREMRFSQRIVTNH